MTTKAFNIRVYGLLINENKEVLVSDEFRFGRHFTKFPGGGLEWGEGLEEALVREWKEELGIQITLDRFFYVNDFFQQSAFRANDQIISFYYFVNTDLNTRIHFGNENVQNAQEGEFFRWLKIDEIEDDSFTFPIDKRVGVKLRSEF